MYKHMFKCIARRIFSSDSNASVQYGLFFREISISLDSANMHRLFDECLARQKFE